MEINKAGLWGEIYAARYLRDNGYRIIAANYRRRSGEVDLIAQKSRYICFVEVKARGENALALPREAVDTFKQERIISASKIFLKEFNPKCQPRFDVCEVYLDGKMKPKRINYIENAFNG